MPVVLVALVPVVPAVVPAAVVDSRHAPVVVGASPVDALAALVDLVEDPGALPGVVVRAWDVAVPTSVGPVAGVGTSKSWSRPSSLRTRHRPRRFPIPRSSWNAARPHATSAPS